MFHDNIGHAVEQLKKPSASSKSECRWQIFAPLCPANIEKQIVLNENILGLLAVMNVIPAHNVHAGQGMRDDIISNRYVLDSCPWGAAVRVPWSDDNGKAVLIRSPAVLEIVIFKNNVPCILQLEEIVNDPVSSVVAWVIRFPAERLRKGVVPNLNIRRNQTGDRGIAAAEHHILPGGLQIIVLDDKWAGTVPPQKRLSVTVGLFEVREVRIVDLDRAAVQRDSTPRTDYRVAMNVHAIEDD